MLHIAQVTRGDGGLAAYVVRDETGAQVFPRPDRTDAAETEAACADYIARNPRATCEWCGGEADPRTTCPKSVECPTCHAKPGSSCRRPSGHRAMSLHAGRIALAESTDPGSQLPLGAEIADHGAAVPQPTEPLDTLPADQLADLAERTERYAEENASRFPETAAHQRRAAEGYRAELRRRDDARAAHSDAWEAFHRHGGPSPLDSRTTGETVPADCTGYIDELGHLAHDGATCPVHESGDVDRGDERETGDDDGPEPGNALMLDQLASNARTALDDPCGITGLEEWRRDYGRAVDIERLDAAVRYAIAQADLIINTLNPADLDGENAAGALTVLGRHIEDVRDRLEAEDVIEKERSLIGDAIAAALDHLDLAIKLLKGDDDV